MCIYAPQVNFLRSASDEKMICVARIPQVQGMVPTTTKSFIYFMGCHTAMLMGSLYENKREMFSKPSWIITLFLD